MLPKNGKYDKWEECIDRLLGDTGWREEFYKKDPQMTLFDLFPEPGQSDGERMVKDANPEHIKDYILARLRTIFPCVSKHARILGIVGGHRCSYSVLPLQARVQKRKDLHCGWQTTY